MENAATGSGVTFGTLIKLALRPGSLSLEKGTREGEWMLVYLTPVGTVARVEAVVVAAVAGDGGAAQLPRVLLQHAVVHSAPENQLPSFRGLPK